MMQHFKCRLKSKAYLEEGEVGAHAAVAARPEAHKAEGLRLVLRPGGGEALGLVLPRPGEHVVQAVRKGGGGGCDVALGGSSGSMSGPGIRVWGLGFRIKVRPGRKVRVWWCAKAGEVAAMWPCKRRSSSVWSGGFRI